MKKVEKVLLIALVVILAVYWNYQCFDPAYFTLDKIRAMNDVGSVLNGFHSIHSFMDTLKWWHGGWIETGTPSLRPISSYLLYLDTWLIFQRSYIWTSLIGMVLFVVDCLLVSTLAWQFTKSKIIVCLAIILATSMRFWTWDGAVPSFWLGWYPVHHDLLMIGFMLAAIATFNHWIENHERKYLIFSWIFFILGCLSKEYVYIFPIIAFNLVFFRPKFNFGSHKKYLVQSGFMLFTACALFLFRHFVLIGAHNPPSVGWFHDLKNMALFVSHPYYIYVFAGEYWQPGLAVLLVMLTLGVVKLYKGGFLDKLGYAPLAVLISGLVVAVYCQSTYGFTNAVLYFLDFTSHAWSSERSVNLLCMSFLAYVLYLVWKDRKISFGLFACVVLVVSYLPVMAFLGWHYTLTGAFIRAGVFWPVMASLAIKNLEEIYRK